MLMGDFFSVWALKAKLRRIKEQKKYLAQVARTGVQKEHHRLEREEAKVLKSIQKESKTLSQMYGS